MTEAWKEENIINHKSLFRRFLLTLPGVEEDDLIPKTSLQSLGLLWCQGKIYYKAMELFNSLNINTISNKIANNNRKLN